jgi:glutathione peroxidase
MTKFILIISCFFLLSMTYTESVYIHSIKTIEGPSKSISDYQGKKLLIITLPIQQNVSNDSLLSSIDSLRAVQGSSLVIIAVPSYEDGYTPAIKNQLKNWYRTKLNTAVIITEGLYTRKTSGSQQHPLFKWLTDKNKNTHFDNDVTGPRQKFIVWKDGQIIGSIASQTTIGSAVIHGLLQD